MTLATNIDDGEDFPSRSQHENPHAAENSVSKEHGTIMERSFENSSERVEDIPPNDDTREDMRETFPWFVLRASKEPEIGIHHLPRFNAFSEDEQKCKLNHEQPNQKEFRNDDMIEKVQHEDGEQYEGCSNHRFFRRFVLTYGPIGAGVVLFWRGLWTVMDMYLFPDDPLQSGWVSLLMGLGTADVTQFPNWNSKRNGA
ncbi:fuseless domain containing protein [Nitzschia inconspicua]|uniref:Fuseless domain containing protein n=1 Tax=Nitzschia inconspicua TaxID=303405 RepID=A0A9K3L977_9STRA|nr:fuseless domain containing protein [Nitzschia inconspicua]